MNKTTQNGDEPGHAPGSGQRDPALSLERLAQILDAYGAAPDRWPDRERDAAERLLSRSEEARALARLANEVDARLDAVVPVEVSHRLWLRVLAAAPPRHVRLWQRTLMAAVPVAAAAALVAFFSSATAPTRPLFASEQVQVGQYLSPTDVLLGSIGVDISDSIPSVGCADSDLGCGVPAIDPLERTERSAGVRKFA